VMVIAGPGTGKTQVLAMRIAKMILQTDISAYNILCLTFTDAAATNMRRRLASFVGSMAYKVHIETFHSFSNKVVDIYQEALNINEFEVISELEEYEIFQQLITELPTNHRLKKLGGDTFYIWTKLKNFFNDFEKENWQNILPQKIEQYLHSIIQYPAKHPTFYYKKDSKYGKKGELKKKEYEDIEKKLGDTQAAVSLYPEYKKRLQEKKVYTFNDMLLWTIQLFQQKPEILLRYQERFQYICVDEYQDTSGIQRTILDLLTAYWEQKANIFVVGDDDQSIYRFQGANMDNIELFIAKYESEITKIVIDTNYRSTPEILYCAEGLIENNKKRICHTEKAFTKHLHSPITTPGSIPILAEYENSFEEAWHVSKKIKHLIGVEKVHPQEIAVLYRNHRLSEILAQCLSEEKIPFQLSRSVNILEEPLILKIIIFLEYIAIEGQKTWHADDKLFEILHFDIYSLSASNVAILALKAKRKTIRQVIIEQSPKDFFKTTAGKELTRIFDMLEALIKDFKNYTLQHFLLHMIQKSGIMQYVMKSPDRLWQMELINSFLSFIKQETFKQKDLSLKQLLQRIREYQYRNLPIMLVRTIAVQNGVELMTCHKAKGLEFEHVFIIACNAKEWEEKRNRQYSFTLPDNIYIQKQQEEHDNVEEERRLFFVGITRAEKYLYISYAKKNDMKDISPSQFVTEIEEKNRIKRVEVLSLSETQQVEALSMLFKEEEVTKIVLVEKQLIEEVLEKYILAPTHLNAFLACPIQFYYNNIIKAPGVMSASATYGSAVHSALEKIMPSFDKETNTRKEIGTADELVQYFLNYILANREVFTEREFEIYQQRGEKNLRDFYAYKIENWEKENVIMTEVDTRRIGNIIVGDVSVRGVLDKLIFQGNSVIIIDYKTGEYSKSKNQEKRFDRPFDLLDENEQERINKKYKGNIPQSIFVGGDYWRQAVFYKILLEKIPYKMWKGNTIIFEFVEQEDNQFWEEKIIVTDADQKFLEQQIKETYKKIKNHEFSVGCGEENCSWCNFVKSYHLQITPSEESEMME
ncbi:MAG: UvrD-helicase domain-containing protein, partial [Chitinophagaceae bacterium]